jgi:hypothetical protein
MHIVRYTVKPDRVAENEQLLAAIFDELREVGPEGLRYTALKLDDGLTFLHLIDHDSDARHLPGRQLDSLRAFHAGLSERCEAAPERTQVRVIGEFARTRVTLTSGPL